MGLENIVNDICQRWYQASETNINTNERAKLYEDTEQLGKDISKADATMKQVAQEALSKGFNHPDPSKMEKLTVWIANNTSTPAPDKYNGAYSCLHTLFETIKEKPKIDGDCLILIESYKGLKKIPDEIENLIYSNLSSKDLIAVSVTSQQNRMNAIFQLNKGSICLKDLGFNNLTDVIKFFEERCDEITRLDLSGFPKLYDRDIETISKSFINLNHLVLEEAKITNKSIEHFANLQQLTSLDLTRCWKIENVNLLGMISGVIGHLLFGYNYIDNISFLEKLPNLTSLGLSGCNNVENFSFLENLTKLKSLNLSGCWMIKEAKFLEKLPNLTSLDLSRCNQIEDLKLEKNTNLISLYLKGCDQIKNANFLENFTKLKYLDLNGCSEIEVFSFLTRVLDKQKVVKPTSLRKGFEKFLLI